MFIRLLAFLLVACRCAWFAVFHWPRVKRDARTPQACQEYVLCRILETNSDTRIGRELHFAGIGDYATFAARVPLHDYERLRPLIMKQIHDGGAEVVAEQPVFYAKTSGTTGQPKFIPVTTSSLAALRRSLNLMSFRQFVARPMAFSGALLTLTSGPEEGRLSNGIPYGSTSGLVYAHSPRIFARKFVVPPAVLALEDFDLRYRLILAIGLRRSDTTYLATANPSTVLMLQQYLERHANALLNGMEVGGFAPGFEELPDELVKQLKPLLHARPRRAAWLRQVLERNGRLTLADIWPRIRLLGCWMGGSCGVALSSARTLLPENVTVIDLGYLSSEFRGTVALHPDERGGLPTMRENFFEFAEQGSWESGQRDFLRLHELERGRNYYVFITTRTGLYRYDMNDLVTVTGFFMKTPLLSFLQKGKGVTSITGEKLYETQVLAAWNTVLAELDLSADFCITAADVSAARYRSYVQLPSDGVTARQLVAVLDRALCELNVEYNDKRASGRLKAMEVCLLRPGSAERFRKAKVGEGQRDSQFKFLSLCYQEELGFDFDAEVTARHDGNDNAD